MQDWTTGWSLTLVQRTCSPWFPKRINLTTEQFSILPQFILNELWSIFLPLVHKISPDSLNLLILCTLDGGIFKVFAIFHWKTFFWNCYTAFPQILCLLSGFVITGHETDLLPFNLISFKMPLQLFLTVPFTFPALFQLFWVVLLPPPNSNWVNIFHEILFHFQHPRHGPCSIMNKIWVYEICKILLFFLQFTQYPNIWVNWSYIYIYIQLRPKVYIPSIKTHNLHFLPVWH